jgi:hypothetical protein
MRQFSPRTASRDDGVWGGDEDTGHVEGPYTRRPLDRRAVDDYCGDDFFFQLESGLRCEVESVTGETEVGAWRVEQCVC